MAVGERQHMPTAFGLPLKHLSLFMLTFQNSALILIMHYSRTMPQNGSHRYLPSTAVFLNELIKLALSLSIALYDISFTLPPSTPVSVFFSQLFNAVFSGDGWKMAVPAVLYTLQNSLQYIAVGNLDAVHFQILYQLKKWLSLALLTVGIAIVQLPYDGLGLYADVGEPSSKRFFFPRSSHELGQIANGAVNVAAELTKRSAAFAASHMKRSATYEGIQEDLGLSSPAMNYSIGCSAVLAAALISGLTGVYFEKVLKESVGTVSVWTRNVQLSFYSLFPALLVGVIWVDGEDVATRGFFDGYNTVVWAAIIFQAVGGILVAATIAYSDSISKNFATSISIIVSCVFSVWFFDFNITSAFIIGTLLVFYATFLYSDDATTMSAIRGRPPPIDIVEYQKTQIHDIKNGGLYTPRNVSRSDENRQHGALLDPLRDVKSAGSSTSRPGSPMRQHSRIGIGSKGRKRED